METDQLTIETALQEIKAKEEKKRDFGLFINPLLRICCKIFKECLTIL